MRRRSLLRHGAMGSVALLAACTPARPSVGGPTSAAPTAAPTPQSASSGSGASHQFPGYVPFAGPAPDLPGTDQGVAQAFFTYPQNLVSSVASPPGQGGDVSLYTVIAVGGTAPPPVEQNPAWQQLNKALNVNLNIDAASNTSDAAIKISTLVAGSNLPDIIYLGPSTSSGLAHLPDFLEASCQDLTPYLVGDAIKSFPNLAALSPYVWKGSGIYYNGKLFGVPVARNISNMCLIVHQEMLDQAGVGAIRSADDFKQALVSVTRPNDGVYGITEAGGAGGSVGFTAQMFGAPNNWGLDASGKLIKDYETDAFRSAVGYVRDLWAAGVFHPNAMTGNTATAQTALIGGQAVCLPFLETSMDFFWPRMSNAEVRILPPFSADGVATPRYFLGPGNVGASVLKKADDARIREVLGVLNYIAAPFGSTERRFLTYGIEGVDFTTDSQGNPVPVPGGYYDHPVPLTLVASGVPALYNPFNSRDYANVVHGFEEIAIPEGVQDATLGLYSPANGSTGPSIKQTVTDAINDIVAGRRPLSDWDGVVAAWRSSGGDQIRNEYAAAMG